MYTRYYDDVFASTTIVDHQAEESKSSQPVTEKNEMVFENVSVAKQPEIQTPRLYNEDPSDAFVSTERDYQTSNDKETATQTNQSSSSETIFGRLYKSISNVVSAKQEQRYSPDHYIQRAQDNMGGEPIENEETAKVNLSTVINSTLAVAPVIAVGLVSKPLAMKMIKPMIFSGTLLGVTRYSQIMTLDKSLVNVDTPAFQNQELNAKIGPSQMLKTDVDKIPDDKLFVLHFARKTGFNDLIDNSPFSHSAIGFLAVDEHKENQEKKWLVLGRQSTMFLRPEHKHNMQHKHKHNHHEDTISGKVERALHTVVDNEKKYTMMEDAPFVPEASAAVLTGAEIKQIVSEVNEAICKKQTCTMVYSNCYSASIPMLSTAIKLIDARTNCSDEEKDKQIASLYGLLQRAAKDNGSEGVADNNRVIDFIKQASKIVSARKLVSDQRSINKLD